MRETFRALSKYPKLAFFISATGAAAVASLSKLVPGGAAWGAAGGAAEGNGISPDSLSFAAATGGADAAGVFVGHAVYAAIKRAIDPKTFLKGELGVGAILATGAAVSGTSWQPVYNFLGTKDLDFLMKSFLTGALCAVPFFGGACAGRVIGSRIFGEHIIPALNRQMLRETAKIAVGVGGASAFFTLTDPSKENPCRKYFGANEGDPIGNSAKSGATTGLGFFVTMTALNAAKLTVSIAAPPVRAFMRPFA